MLYLATGKESFLRDEFVHQLRARMLALPMGEHNLDEVGPDGSVEQVIGICNAVPFLCEKRMVIMRGLLGRAGRPRARSRRTISPATPSDTLASYLPSLPATTHLVIVEDDRATVDPFVVVVPDAVKRDFAPKRDEELPRWIGERATKHGASIQPRAAMDLAQLVGSDLRLLDSEIAKLAAYEPPGGAITSEHVQLLIAGGGPDIFALQDAIAERRAAAALAVTHQLLERGHDPIELLAHAIGVVRRLLIVKELVVARRPVAQEVGAFGLSTSPYFLQKLQRQVARVTSDELVRDYLVLRDTDRAIKTGQVEPTLGLELAVATLVGMRAAGEVA